MASANSETRQAIEKLKNRRELQRLLDENRKERNLIRSLLKSLPREQREIPQC